MVNGSCQQHIGMSQIGTALSDPAQLLRTTGRKSLSTLETKTMPFINVNLDEAEESQPAAAGMYNLQITECKLQETGANSKVPGSPMFRVTIGFPDEPNVPNLSQFIMLPTENDEPKQLQMKMLNLRRFLTLFNIPYDSNGIDTDQLAMEMPGHTANAEVTLTEPDDNGNVYNRLKVPRIKGEAAAGNRKPPARKR